jgi:hypothetical protein
MKLSRTRAAKGLEENRSCFAISFELMLSMVLLVWVCSVTIYFAQVFQTERYFADVTASTCTLAARYGGDYSKVYQLQTGADSISSNANAQLAYLDTLGTSGNRDGLFDANITVSPEKPDSSGTVNVTLTYKLKTWATGSMSFLEKLGLGGKTITQSFELPSLVQSGKLLD